MVRLTGIDLAGIGHGLVLDVDETKPGMVAEALFSPCVHGHESSVDCRAWSDVSGLMCRRFRYALTRTWDAGLPECVFVMLNPSTANAFVVDPTIRRCMDFARRWGCGGLAVVNAYALRSTRPSGLRTADPVGPANDAVITAVVSAAAGPVVVAWGADELLRRSGRGTAVHKLLLAAGASPECLNLTQGGHPGHPLYLPADTPRIPFPAKAAVNA